MDFRELQTIIQTLNQLFNFDNLKEETFVYHTIYTGIPGTDGIYRNGSFAYVRKVNGEYQIKDFTEDIWVPLTFGTIMDTFGVSITA